jgi:hypothetical protein
MPEPDNDDLDIDPARSLSEWEQECYDAFDDLEDIDSFEWKEV